VIWLINIASCLRRNCVVVCCCFDDKRSDENLTQHRESYVEMDIDAFDDNNATSGIDDVNRVGGGVEYHQL
jgi:hypothetical protein